ncbi:MAG: glycosyl transferase family 1 [Candidatus Moranbacteria bacterium CG_4_8_14_3_um_filter_34_16]|nr:MAG: glycosyl transferase family 1 [Candidatus Moranbacteria bacterium CG_4_8_14_3_um_filter_34_16]
MKIAFIGQKGIQVISGGVERRVEEISVRMAQRGHQVFVYARKDYSSDKCFKKEFKGVKIIYLPAILTKNLSALTHTFLATIHSLFQSYDVIHFQEPGPSSLCWIIKIFSPRTALIATFNSRDNQHQKWGYLAKKYLLWGEWVISKFPDKVISASETLQKYMKEKYQRKSEIIYNGASNLEINEPKLIERFSLEKEKYILSVSRLIRHKGIHYLIKAFDNLQKEKKIPSEFKLAIAGEGAYTDDYVKEIKELSLKNKNIIFTGNQNGKNLSSLFQNSFVFVQPSETEGLSNTLLEAMGYGICPIISDIEENVIPVNGNGIIFKNKDVKDLEEKLIFAFKNKEIVKEKGKQAQVYTRNKYSWEENTSKTLKIYEKILEKKKNIR